MKEINSIDEFNKITHRYNTTNYYEFENYIINIPISFETARIISFSNCIFNKKISIRGHYTFKVNINKCIFNEETNFDNTEFKETVRIQETVFNSEVSFDNSKFYKLCDFWNTTFNKVLIFYKTIFEGVTVFSRCTFNENVLFTYSFIKELAVFRGAHFLKGLDLSSAIISGTLNFFDAYLKDFKTTDNIINEDEYETSITETGNIPTKNKRETFRIIKKQLQNQENHILALDYSALELQVYSAEVKKHSLKSINAFQNYLILKLNYLSNRNGTSWLQGVLFTLIVGLTFHILLLISTNEIIFTSNINFKFICGEGLSYFIEFLTPTHSLNFLSEKGMTSLSFLIDFTGRIFVAYGIYQTIQSFRKYKKG